MKHNSEGKLKKVVMHIIPLPEPGPGTTPKPEPTPKTQTTPKIQPATKPKPSPKLTTAPNPTSAPTSPKASTAPSTTTTTTTTTKTKRKNCKVCTCPTGQDWCRAKNKCVKTKDFLKRCKCPWNKNFWCEERNQCMTKNQYNRNCKCPSQGKKWCKEKNRCIWKTTFVANCKCPNAKKWCQKKHKCVKKVNICQANNLRWLEQNLPKNKINELQREAFSHYWQSCGFRYKNETNIMARYSSIVPQKNYFNIKVSWFPNACRHLEL